MIARLGVLVVAALTAGCTYGLVEKIAPAETAFMRGRYAEALTLTERGRTHPATSETGRLVLRCESYGRLKDYARLFKCLDLLETRVKRGGDQAWTWTFDRWGIPQLWGWRKRDMSAMPHLLRAEAFIELGRYEAAVGEAASAFTIARDRDLQVGFHVHALSLLSLAQALSGDRAAAERTAATLDAISTPFLRNQKLTGLARTYMALGRYDLSLGTVQAIGSESFQSFVDWITTAAVRGESVFVWSALPRDFVLAKSLHETGKTAEAKAIYDRLLKHPATPDSGDIHWALLFDRGRIAEADGDVAAARDLYIQAIEVVERQRSSIHTTASKIGYVADKQAVYGRLVARLVADGAGQQAFEYAERARSRALVDLLAGTQSFAAAAGDVREVRSTLTELDVVEAATRAEGSDLPGDGRRRRSEAAQALREKLKVLGPDLASLVTVTASPAGDIQRQLAADEVLLEYYVHDRALHVFVVTAERLTAVTVDAAGLADEVAAFRTALDHPRSTDARTRAAALYERLVRPVAGLLAGARLTIVPHGVLHYLPFHALGGPDGYVIERYGVRYLPSASVLPYLIARRPQAARSVLVIADPELPGRRLPGAAREASTVADQFARATVLVGTEATETAFRTLAPRHSHLHVAAHGRFDSSEPLTSGLLLGPDGQHDGVLTVDEIFSLRLQADVVTLSACETGLGAVNRGDDVIGLTRGLLYAGARAVVASLWRVDDEATLDLMTEFYDALATRDAAEALRAAQLAILHEYGHPFYWAAFQLTGQP